MRAGERMDIALAADDREAGKLGLGYGPYASREHNLPGDEPGIRPEVVQVIFSALTDQDPGKLEQITDAGVTAEYRQAVSLYANGAHLSLDHRERELRACRC